MTQRLYYENAYLTEFDAEVVGCIPEGDAWKVCLNQSAFYPTSGGQPFDTGTLGAARVLDVYIEDGEMVHLTDAPLNTGETVHGVIDWDRRFDHMQQHAADHMIASAIHRMFHGTTIGLHIGSTFSTIDVAMPEGVTRMTPEDIQRIEMVVNTRIQRDVPIRCWFPNADELRALPLRKAPTVQEHVRIVAIGADEMVACGGTHPSSAGQVGLVKILNASPARGKMRVAFVAGMRAFLDYRHCYEAAHAASDALSTGTDKLPDSVMALRQKLSDAEHELSGYKKEALRARLSALDAQSAVLDGGVRLIAAILDADIAQVRDLAAEYIRKGNRIVLIGARQEAQTLFVFGRSEDVATDMGKLLSETARQCGGKGGGRPDFAQGGGPEAMLDAALQILTSGVRE